MRSTAGQGDSGGLLRLDIGCGGAKTPGFTGVDRFALPGVDVVCDLNGLLPFASESVDYVLFSHSLEHLEKPFELLRDVHRVCKPGAKVTIIGPYGSTRLNQANPYHLNNWNEHSARFLTTAMQFPPESGALDFPRVTVFGLAESDNSQWSADFLLCHQEYFYFPPYRNLPANLKELLRRSLSDVCDEFVLHFIIPKGSDVNVRPEFMSELFEETHTLKNRRLLEAETGSSNEIATLFTLAADLEQLRKQHAASLQSAEAERHEWGKTMADLQHQVMMLKRFVASRLS